MIRPGEVVQLACHLPLSHGYFYAPEQPTAELSQSTV